jgi:uncharacterized protein (DUF4415 family)
MKKRTGETRGRTIMVKKSSASSRRAGRKSVKSEDIRGRKWTESERQALRHAAERQLRGDDSDIDFRDMPRLTEEQLANLVRLRHARRKVAVSVRLDPQVLEWLKAKGQGHLTRINDILLNVMEAERGRGFNR